MGILLEMSPAIVHQFGSISRMLSPLLVSYQAYVYDQARFLTGLRGRGLFYMCIGAFTLTRCVLCLLFACGALNFINGVICISLSFGIDPLEHTTSALESDGHGP